MSKDEWDVFLGVKKRTATTHYSLGRRCERCGTFIVNKNKTGFCRVCWRIPFNIAGNQGRESDEHKRIKELAKKWLERAKCSEIKTEAHIQTKTGRILVDVTGKYNGKRMIVECGGSQRGKLDKALSVTPNVYIWPYHHTKPYLFKVSMNICTSCGNFKWNVNQ